MSCEAKKKKHACASSGLHDHYSELFTRMAALKLLNAVTKPPEQISLRDYLPNTFYLGRTAGRYAVSYLCTLSVVS